MKELVNAWNIRYQNLYYEIPESAYNISNTYQSFSMLPRFETNRSFNGSRKTLNRFETDHVIQIAIAIATAVF